MRKFKQGERAEVTVKFESTVIDASGLVIVHVPSVIALSGSDARHASAEAFNEKNKVELVSVKRIAEVPEDEYSIIKVSLMSRPGYAIYVRTSGTTWLPAQGRYGDLLHLNDDWLHENPERWEVVK